MKKTTKPHIDMTGVPANEQKRTYRERRLARNQFDGKVRYPPIEEPYRLPSFEGRG